MARPKKLYRVKVNKGSIQFYEDGNYLGNWSIKKVCQLLKSKNNLGKKQVLEEKGHNENFQEFGGFGTELR
jgi:hypothetical protein